MTMKNANTSAVTGFSVTTIEAAAQAAATRKEETRKTLAGMKPALVKEDTVLPCSHCGLPRQAAKMRSRGALDLIAAKAAAGNGARRLEVKDVILDVHCPECARGKGRTFEFMKVLQAVEGDELRRAAAIRARKDAELKKAAERQAARLSRNDPAAAINYLHRKAEAAAQRRVAEEERAKKARKSFAHLVEDMVL